MAFSSANEEDVRLVSLPGLLLMLAVIITVLYLLFPRRALFEEPDLLAEPDPLAIAYLQAVLRSAPERHDVRLALARQMLRVGDIDEAERLVLALPGRPPRLARERDLLTIQILARKVYASTDETRRKETEQALARLLHRFEPHRADVETLNRLLEAARILPGEGAFRVQLLDALARQALGTDPAWLQQAAKEALAAGDPAAAARFYRLAANSLPEEQASSPALEALRAALMSGDPSLALVLVESFLERWPRNAALLEQGIAIARANNALEKARAWNRRLTEQRPDDPRVWRRARDLALAAGDPVSALAAARRLRMLENRPEDERRYARLLEWNGRPGEALAHWVHLGGETPSEPVLMEIVRLARATNDSSTELNALQMLSARRPLNEGEIWRLAALEEFSGRPEEAERILKRYLDAYPENRRFWERRLQLAEAMADPRLALQIIDGMERQFGAQDALLRRKARLQWLDLKESEAWTTLRRLRQPLVAGSAYDLLLHSELAWRQGTSEEALAFHKGLFEKLLQNELPDGETQDRLIDVLLQRLLVLAEQAGDHALAARVGRQGWRISGDTGLLLAAVGSILRAGDLARAEALILEGLKSRDTVPRARLHLMLGDLRLRQGRPEAALAQFRRALGEAPHLVEAQAALLWALLDTGRLETLERRLQAWHATAPDQPLLWGPFAAGYHRLGAPRKALPWYRRVIQRHSKDPMWLLNFADLQQALGHHDAAWRLRRRALMLAASALGREEAEPALRQAWIQALATQEGIAAAQPFAERERDLLFRAAWARSQEADTGARFWLAKAHWHRLQLPAWQAVAQALADNDLPRMERLLETEQLAPLDRVRILERLGRLDAALAAALPLVDAQRGETDLQTATQWAALLYRERPTTATAKTEWERIGDLDLKRVELEGRLSLGQSSLRLSLVDEQFDMDPEIYDLSGRDREWRLGMDMEWFGRRNKLSAGLGLRRRDDRSHTWSLFAWDYDLDRRHRLGLLLEHNGTSTATQLVRADVLANRVRLTWNGTLTSRTGLQLQLEGYRLLSRDGDHVADGTYADITLTEKLMLGTNELAVRLQGSWLRNDLADRLPEEMARRLPPGSTIRDVIDARYSVVGVGMAMARGEPLGRAPLVGGLRYRLDGWVGWEWPENGPAAALSAAIGTRVFGGDELALEYYYSRALNLDPGQASQGWTLQYRVFLGR